MLREIDHFIGGESYSSGDRSGDVFDPNRHEAVLHEPAGPDDDPALSVVVEVLRIGYGWKGRVVRPAMVKVRG